MLRRFYIIVYRNGEFVPWDVMPYFLTELQDIPNSKKPKTRQELKEWIELASKENYSGRGQYEVILSDWPKQKQSTKLDAYTQVMMNVDIIMHILIQTLKLPL